MLGYNGYIKVGDGQHSVDVKDPCTITITAKNGVKTIVNCLNVDFKTQTYHRGRYVPCIVGYKTTQNRKLIEQERYGMIGKGFYKDKTHYIPYADGTWNGRHGEIVRRGEKLFGVTGVCRTRYSRGRILGQRFIYSNGFTAYEFKGNDTNCLIKYPNGKIAYEHKSETPICLVIRKDAWREREGYPFFKRNQMPEQLNYSFVLYDRKGKIKAQGEYKDRQQIGKWVVNYKEQFFINGVMVDKKLYEQDPKTINPKRVLNHPNAQFRAMLLKKIGLDRVVKECKGVLIDQDKVNDYALYDFPVKSTEKDDLERKLRILKLTCPSTKQQYFLRIPADPHFDTCYKARQGTFNGFDPDAKPLEFALET